MSYLKKEFTFPSVSGLADIHCASYLPENGEVRAVVQVAHGMAEHLERYEKFARVLAENGIALYINDHLGHGASVKNDDELGYFGEKEVGRLSLRTVMNLPKSPRVKTPASPTYSSVTQWVHLLQELILLSTLPKLTAPYIAAHQVLIPQQVQVYLLQSLSQSLRATITEASLLIKSALALIIQNLKAELLLIGFQETTLRLINTLQINTAASSLQHPVTEICLLFLDTFHQKSGLQVFQKNSPCLLSQVLWTR